MKKKTSHARVFDLALGPAPFAPDEFRKGDIIIFAISIGGVCAVFHVGEILATGNDMFVVAAWDGGRGSERFTLDRDQIFGHLFDEEGANRYTEAFERLLPWWRLRNRERLKRRADRLRKKGAIKAKRAQTKKRA